MASGDNLRKRGQLTKAMIRGLSTLLSNHPVLSVDEISVSFFGPRPTAVRLCLLDALQSVTFDISQHGDDDWHDADRVNVLWLKTPRRDLLGICKP